MVARTRNKRQPKDAMGATADSRPIDYVSLIGSLSSRTLCCNILLHAVQQHPDVAMSIDNVLLDAVQQHPDVATSIVNAQRSENYEFPHYSRLAWKVLNITYRDLRNSQQLEKGPEAANEVRECIEALRKAAPADTCFCTKKEALETLRKIGKSICLSGGRLGHEVRKVFQVVDCLESTMLRIAKRLTMEERNAVMTEKFVDKLVELEELSSSHGMFGNLKDVRLVLLGELESESD